MLKLKAERITGDLGVIFHSLRKGATCDEDVEEYANVSGGFNEFYLRFYARYDDIIEVVPVVEGPYRIDEARERMEFILSLTLDYMHDNRYDDYDKSIPKIFVETYKAAYKKGYDDEHMAAQF